MNNTTFRTNIFDQTPEPRKGKNMRQTELLSNGGDNSNCIHELLQDGESQIMPLVQEGAKSEGEASSRTCSGGVELLIG